MGRDSSDRAATTTWAPAAARPMAMALPMPRLAPVTIATLPSRLMLIRSWCAWFYGLGVIAIYGLGDGWSRKVGGILTNRTVEPIILARGWGGTAGGPSATMGR